ncbi:MAG TPA: PRC-barrel domain-containing protein [Anaerolineales bacterium]
MEEQSEREVPLSDRIPQRIGEGMPVYDRDGEAVGTVKTVYLGGASDEAIERALNPEQAPPTPAGETVSTAFEADDIPRELRARFMKQGYLVVEGPDITGTRGYLGPEQIEGLFTQELEGGTIRDAVRLRLTRGELLSA